MLLTFSNVLCNIDLYEGKENFRSHAREWLLSHIFIPRLVECFKERIERSCERSVSEELMLIFPHPFSRVGSEMEDQNAGVVQVVREDLRQLLRLSISMSEGDRNAA